MRLIKFAMAAATLLPLASYATLGAAPGNGASSPAILRATPSSVAASQPPTAATSPYSVSETRDANGVTIREYALPSNLVFAVTWNGPIRPDMSTLLGTYFRNYVDAGKRSGRGTGPLFGDNGELRVESAGRLGHFFGTAYLPRLMPAGVRPSDLQ
ncbi:DUF2844 domain-containing protein [Paraburkholderia xenovorans]|uniref:DUF2844 domain-containing protein n=1 Tax=Paraburkholderia xenovorans TaxID=36873 RepID=UPI0038B9D1E5